MKNSIRALGVCSIVVLTVFSVCSYAGNGTERGIEGSRVNQPAAAGDSVIDCVEYLTSSATKSREFWLYFSNDKLVGLQGGLGMYWPGTLPTTSIASGPDLGFSVESTRSSSGEYVYRFGFNATELLGPEGSEHRYGYGEIHFDPQKASETKVRGAEYSKKGFLNRKQKISNFGGSFSCQLLHPSELVQKCLRQRGYDSLGSMFMNDCQKLWDNESYRQSHLDTIRSYFNY